MNLRKRFPVLRLTVAAALGLVVVSVAEAAPVEVHARAFPLDRVHLLAGPFKDRQDDQRIPATLRPGKRDGFFEAAYAIPPVLTRGKREVTVRLVASGARSGTFGLRIVEASVITDTQWKEGVAP